MKWKTPEDIKENLKLYRKLKRSVVSLCRDLNQASNTNEIDRVKGSSNCFPYTKRSYAVRGISYRNIEGIKNKIHISDLKLKEIEKFVDSLEDILVQEAVRNHYIYGDTWQKVAFEMGYSNDSTVKMMVKRYFEKL